MYEKGASQADAGTLCTTLSNKWYKLCKNPVSDPVNTVFSLFDASPYLSASLIT